MDSAKKKSRPRKKQTSALDCLRNIKPFTAIAPKYQLLTFWDPRRKLLRFGCGGRENAVFVYSNKKLEKTEWADEGGARISPATIHRFVDGWSKVKGKDLFERCEELLRSYLHVDDERLYTLFAVWTMATYVYRLFSHFGYLFVHSTFPRSGKTRVEEVLSHLCFEATVPLNAPTVPTIRDTAAEGRTLVLDTLERWKEKNPEAHGAAMELLDAGFRNGGMVAKMVSVDGKWRKEQLPVYAPYVLAAIARESLTDTALDRSFVVEMRRKPVTIKKRKYRYHQCERECEPLRDDLYRWALENARALNGWYESTELEVAVDALELNDRAADIWKPLLAVARVLGGARIWESLTSLAIAMCRDPEAAERDRIRRIARSLRGLVNGNGAAVGMTSTFVAHLGCDGLEVKEGELHEMLTQWGFAQESVRLDSGPRRAWVLADGKLAEIEQENGPISPC